MCGILFCLCHDPQQKELFKRSLLKTLIKRGPDAQNSHEIIVENDGTPVYLSFHGTVLHMRKYKEACLLQDFLKGPSDILSIIRGERVTDQPLISSNGNVLLWNGEVFGGRKVKVGENENDTKALMNALLSCTSDQDLVQLFSSVQGPYAFVYYQANSGIVWYGRDCLGRRSLMSLQDHTADDVLVLTSVGHSLFQTQRFKEVDASIVYKRNIFTGSTEQFLLTVTKNMPVCSTYQHRCLSKTTNCQSDEPCKDQNVEGKCCICLYSESFQPQDNSTVCCSNNFTNDDSKKITQLHKNDDSKGIEHCKKIDSITLDQAGREFFEVLKEAVRKRVYNVPPEHAVIRKRVYNVPSAVGVLFSGGIDSVVLTSLADLCLPKDVSVDLINVAFQQKVKPVQGVKKKNARVTEGGSFDVPDRLTARSALLDLSKDRSWNFIEVNVTLDELQKERSEVISDLIYPLNSVLDDSIGCAIWFAARGSGSRYILSDDRSLVLDEENYHSKVKVLLCGMGADEQLGGYARHRTKYECDSWIGLIKEMRLEMDRISTRNLGRDDRCISDHGREARFPFLDENVVDFLQKLPACVKCDPRLPRGTGEKILLRELAGSLGLPYCSSLPKRAIQFGSRIAKMESGREKAHHVCNRLKKLAVA